MMGKIVTNLGITFSAALVDLSWERGRNREAAEAKRLNPKHDRLGKMLAGFKRS